MKHLFSFSKTFATVALTATCFNSYAGPGALIDSPLFVSAVAKPNILFMIDTSGSMRHIIVEDLLGADPDKYDSTDTSALASCSPDPVTGFPKLPDATNDKIYVSIDDSANAEPFMSLNALYLPNYATSPTFTDVRYSFGTSTDPADLNLCFDPNKQYQASLHADQVFDGRRYPAGKGTTTYSGKYLNWYFKHDNTNNSGGSVQKNWDNGEKYKPGTDNRLNIAQSSVIAIVNNLTDSVRVGLSTFNGSVGVSIDDEIADLTASNKADLITKIEDIDNDPLIPGDNDKIFIGQTPLAETLLQIGYYFVGDAGPSNPGNGSNPTPPYNGHYDGNFILHPNAVLPDTPLSVSSSSIFPSTTGQYSPGGYESPIEYWCQNNFAVLMTDGLSTDDTEIPSVDTSVTPAVPSLLADYDGDCPVSNASCTSNNDQKTASNYLYGNNGSDYLDDVAQAWFEMDLRPDINDNDGNEVTNNIITYTIAFADTDAINNKLLADTANQAGGEFLTASTADELAKSFSAATTSILSTTSSAAAVTFNTSTLGNDTAVYQALFSTALWSGNILSFPVDPVTGDTKTDCTIDGEENCWEAATHLDALAYNKGSSTFVDNRQIITFDSAANKGIPFNVLTGTYSATLPAGGITTDMVKDICAGPNAPALETSGVCSYSATATLTATQSANASKTYINQMIKYIRGDRTYEDLTTTPSFRIRDSVLGDIINSSPAFIGIPKLPWSSLEDPSNYFGVTGNRYSSFKSEQANRTGILYVSANDGMLHAFRTENKTATPGIGEAGGDEIFAYMPSFVFSNVNAGGYHYLANPSYKHKYYLDLSVTFSDVFTQGKNTDGTVDTTADWRTVLIGGSRGGDKIGLFALDVTNPETINETNAADRVLWEFTNSDDPNLGHTYSKPTIALTNVTDPSGNYRWAAIFGNGYQDDSTAVTNGSDCHARLFILFLDGPSLSAADISSGKSASTDANNGGLDGYWKTDTDIQKTDYVSIDTGVGDTTAGDCNGLSTPALADTDGNGTVDRVYAGDVKGNMWAFDLTTGNFDVAYSSSSGSPPTTTKEPLFKAVDDNGTPQPIMVRPAIARNTAATSSGDQNIMVMFGTGQYIANGDNTAIGGGAFNTFYSIWDEGTSGSTQGYFTDDRTYKTVRAAADAETNPATAQSILDAGSYKLVRQELGTVTNIYGQFRYVTSYPIDWSTRKGWYIDLNVASSPDAEERVVVDPVIRSDIIFFNTLIPDSEICGSGGSGWLMSVSYLTGSTSSSNIFDVTGNGIIDAADAINDGTNDQIAVGQAVSSIPTKSSIIGDFQNTQLSDKSINKRKINVAEGLREGRLSWREIRDDD